VKSRCAGRRLRRLRGHGLWTRLGKKKAGCKQFPGRLYDAISTEKTLAPAVSEQKERDIKKTWWEMRSRESPEKVFENEASVLFQGSKTSVRFCE
jgi:hypothetical protein